MTKKQTEVVSGNTVKKVVRKQQRRSTVPMSVQEMRDAVPIPIPELERGFGRPGRKGDGNRKRQIQPLRAGSGAANTAPDAFDIIPGKAPGMAAGAVPAAELKGGYPYPAPYTLYQVPNGDRVRYPYLTMGKLFMSFGSDNFVGSATVIGENMILTAGHCVHSKPDGWADSFSFVPAYDDGTGPLGAWVGVEAYSIRGWVEDENFEFDAAVIVLEPNQSGQSVGNACGQLGMIFNLDPRQHWHSCGYPSITPFDGNELYDNQASYAYDADPTAPNSPIGIGCPMTPGCSGGAWVLDFDLNAGGRGDNLVNGVNSFRWGGNDEEIFSPRFGNDVREMIEAAT